MTEDEIIEAFKKGDELLKQFKTLMLPVAAELARRKSMAAFGRPDLYEGHLGCHDSGINSVCLHITDAGLDIMQPGIESPVKTAAYNFEAGWHDRIYPVLPHHLIYLSGHY